MNSVGILVIIPVISVGLFLTWLALAKLLGYAAQSAHSGVSPWVGLATIVIGGCFGFLAYAIDVGLSGIPNNGPGVIGFTTVAVLLTIIGLTILFGGGERTATDRGPQHPSSWRRHVIPATVCVAVAILLGVPATRFTNSPQAESMALLPTMSDEEKLAAEIYTHCFPRDSGPHKNIAAIANLSDLESLDSRAGALLDVSRDSLANRQRKIAALQQTMKEKPDKAFDELRNNEMNSEKQALADEQKRINALITYKEKLAQRKVIVGEFELAYLAAQSAVSVAAAINGRNDPTKTAVETVQLWKIDEIENAKTEIDNLISSENQAIVQKANEAAKVQELQALVAVIQKAAEASTERTTSEMLASKKEATLKELALSQNYLAGTTKHLDELAQLKKSAEEHLRTLQAIESGVAPSPTVPAPSARP